MEASEERQVILQLPPNTKFPKSRIASELELTQNATPAFDVKLVKLKGKKWILTRRDVLCWQDFQAYPLHTNGINGINGRMIEFLFALYFRARY